MSVVAAIRSLLEKGFTVDQALDAAEAFEAHGKPTRTARQERNARYYEANKERLKASEKRLNKTFKTVSDDDQPESANVPTTLKYNPPSEGNNIYNPPISPQAKPARRKASRLPHDWQIPDEYREFARRKGLSDAEITRQSERMLNWSLSSPNGAKLDWLAVWKNWISDAPNARAGPTQAAPKTTILSQLALDRYDDKSPDEYDAGHSSLPAVPSNLGPSGASVIRLDPFAGRQAVGDSDGEIIPPRRSAGP